jgi:5,6-dimethylbenzimidazole synthase
LDDSRATRNDELPPPFGPDFRQAFAQLCAWRRDVRRFTVEPVAEDLIDELLDIVALSPSVGNSQPWRWVNVASPDARRMVQENFAACNARARATYSSERGAAYAALKLEGLRQAPVQFAVFCDRSTRQGHGLGRATMPETLDYSVVCAVTTFWLAAQAYGLGVGWVSILDPEHLVEALGLPADWHLIAYLCVGRPAERHLDPELERYRWQARTSTGRQVLAR